MLELFSVLVSLGLRFVFVVEYLNLYTCARALNIDNITLNNSQPSYIYYIIVIKFLQ